MSPKNAHKKFRILSIDGGGIRGIIPACVLVSLEEKLNTLHGNPQGKIGEYFDLIAGTSTGGILTCMFLSPDRQGQAGRAKPRFGALDALRLYLEWGDDIFEQSLWRKARSAGGLLDEKYSEEALEKVLRDHFGVLELRELLKPCLVTAYETKRYQPYFFTQHDAIQSADRNFLVRDVARATSAAPTYFETARVDNLDGIPSAAPMIDGGVFANNPSLCAYAEACSKNWADTPEDIVLLSLGTGRKPKRITYKESKDWGLAGWARPLVDILMEGVSQTVDYQLATMFTGAGAKQQYLRVDGEFGDTKARLDIDNLDPAMDCATIDNMKRLEAFGRRLAKNFDAELGSFAELLRA